MKHGKNNYLLLVKKIVFTIIIALTLFGCKKLKTKDPIVFNIYAEMPNTHTPISGLKYRIVEYKEKDKLFGLGGLSELEETGWEKTGSTGSDGKASGSFKGVLKSNYSYKIFFEFDEMQLPNGITNYEVFGASFDVLSRSLPDDNNYTFRILPYTSMHFKVENINCFDANDKIQYKIYNYDESPNLSFETIPWGNPFFGCGVQVENTFDNVLAGHKVCLMEITKNNIVTTKIDTFNLLPNTMNEVILSY